MRTNFYVDGYNLYYGCLKHTPYKWLDQKALLVDHILHSQDPKAELGVIKFFTADVKAKVASQGQRAQIAQQNYHKALELLYPGKIDIIKGYYSLERANLPVFKIPPDKTDRVTVWRLEEKQTDVNIAIEAYRDVSKNLAQQLVFVTNDSDIEPSLRAIREDFGDAVSIGVIVPRRKDNHRAPTASLGKYANWVRGYILEEELKNSQLPELVPTRKKPIKRPDYW
ncbi:NYN domain-containing protein [Marinobacterium iners]|uniref:NYN domain-containing protein n=1 Tax=Marinobacterium iners TaxID=48076 RepID=UPI001A8E5ABA|nr:NYN domain-containing protein [Marinobacterium iners]QSR35894.1 NYN domain-containing protein [Marinobacterium iners]